MKLITSILFVFILITTSVRNAQSGTLPGVMCAYQGEIGHGTFAIDDIPDRCEVIMYGLNLFDAQPPDADSAAITALTSAGKTVYMTYMYDLKVDWNSIISSNDSTTLDTHIAPMLKYLSDNKIKGVLLAFLRLLDQEILEYATKINTFISKIKEGVPGINVGLWVNGWQQNKMRDDTLFNFTLTNPNTDFYLVDTTMTGEKCRKDLNKSGGRHPITSTNSKVASLELIRSSAAVSTMEQSKLLVNLEDEAIKGEGSNTEVTSYSDYCSQNGTDVWCVDTMELLYNHVIYLKTVFKGIMISYIDLDDISNACGCGIHPVAETFIDAWQGKPLVGCPKIG